MASSASGPADAEALYGRKMEVKLPDTFEELLDKPNARIMVFSVTDNLDWRTALDGVRLQISRDGTGEVSVTNSAVQHLAAEVEANPWSRFVPLQPRRAGSQSLVPTGPRVETVLRFWQGSPDLGKTNNRIARQREEERVVEKRRKAGFERSKVIQQARTEQLMKRYRLGSLKDSLRQAGFHCISKATSGGVDDEGEQRPDVVHLKPIEDGEDSVVPMALWNANALTSQSAENLHFQCFEGMKKSGPKIVGIIKGCNVEWLGERPRRVKEGSLKYIVGIRGPKSKRVFLEQAEIFDVHARMPEPVMPSLTDKDYAGLRLQALQNYGAVKNLRTVLKRNAANSRGQAATTLEGSTYDDEQAQRVQELSTQRLSMEDRDKEIRAGILPPYNPSAPDAASVYKDGLLVIAPPDLVQQESALVKRGLLDLLMQESRLQMREAGALARVSSSSSHKPPNMGVIGSQLAAAVLMLRAKGGPPPRTKEAAQAVARQFGVLNALKTLVCRGSFVKGGKCFAPTVADIVELPHDSNLIAHWHQQYYDEMLGHGKARAFNKRKTLCALLVWALYMTPDHKLELLAPVENELGLGNGKLKKALEYIGCIVTQDFDTQSAHSQLEHGEAGKIVAKLNGPPRINIFHYDREAGKKRAREEDPGKGRGKGKKRKEE